MRIVDYVRGIQQKLTEPEPGNFFTEQEMKLAHMKRFMGRKYFREKMALCGDAGELSLSEAIQHGVDNWDRGTDFLKFEKSGNR